MSDKTANQPDQAATAFPDDFDAGDTIHILIEDEMSSCDAKPRTVLRKRMIRNRVGGLVTELTFYEEGFLRVRQGTERRPLKNHLIETRFIDPDYSSEWRVSRVWLRVLLGCLGMTGVAVLVMPFLGYGAERLVAAVAGGTLSLWAGYRFLRNTQETHVFRTARGRAEVLSLDANIGSLRKTRDAARAISQAIGAIGADAGSIDMRELRAEMQAHYRLLENGVISKDACSEGTAAILARFG